LVRRDGQKTWSSRYISRRSEFVSITRTASFATTQRLVETGLLSLQVGTRLQSHDDVNLVKDSIAVPVTFTEVRGLAGFARRIDPEDVVQSACRSFFRNARS
jgi:hypothetical protein